MTVTDTTPRAQTGTISFTFDLQHAPEKVWRALTEPELVSDWLLRVTHLPLEPGAVFTLHAPPQPGWDGSVQCRMLELEPQRRLRYTWTVGELDTVVTFTLEPNGTGTRLSLVQSGFLPGQKRNFGGARYGWRLFAGKLVAVLDRTP